MKNRGGPSLSNGEEAAGRSPRALGRGAGNGTPPRAFVDDTRGEAECGVVVYRSSLGTGRYAFHVQGKRRHMLHARCMVKALARGGARHHFATQQSIAGLSARDGAHGIQGSKGTRVFKIRPRGWKGGPTGESVLHSQRL